MVEVNEFKQWLSENTNYSDAVIGDMASRVKRADKILTWSEEDVYQFRLEQVSEYKTISVSVRSQIKKAVKMYAKFVQSKKDTDKNKLEVEF
jgi:DNA (cytosine-5)-methyltransferase 1